MSALIEQIQVLEKKAADFDGVLARLNVLKKDVADFESGELPQRALVSALKSLISFYEPEFEDTLAKLKSDGFQQGVLKKYVDSTYRQEKIDSVKTTIDGQVFVNTASGQHLIGEILEKDAYMKSPDFVLTCLTHVEDLVLIK